MFTSISSRLLATAFVALALWSPPPRALAQKLDSNISIGQSAHLWSDTLQEERRVLIYLPPHYAHSGTSYPVLYLLDAESQFHHSTGIVQFLASDNGRMPEMIVVGVTNTNRRRDLTPVTHDPEQLKDESGESTGAGGADAFLKFLTDELAPWVDTRYRTAPYRVLSGHSFGGLFAVHALLTRPDAFQAYIAVSPSLWWDKQESLERAKAEIGKVPAGRNFLYLTWGDNEKNISDTTQALVDHLKAHPPANLQWSHRYYPGDDHGTTPHRSLYDGFEALFPDWALQFEINDVAQKFDLAAVESHYAKLSQRYGYTIKPSASAIGELADQLLEARQSEPALELLRRNVREYPWLTDVHVELADALEQQGRPEEALRSYEQALRLAVEDEHPYEDPVAEYRAKVRKLGAKQTGPRP
jgi:predicted alpha/beta superfamily hydrolase